MLVIRPGKILTFGALAAALCFAVPSDAEAQSRVYAAAELSKPASIKSSTAAAAAIERHYPEALRRIGGRVQLQFEVTETGEVDTSTIQVVVASVSALGEAASKAVASIQFNPGQVDGKPVRTVVTFPVTYASR